MPDFSHFLLKRRMAFSKDSSSLTWTRGTDTHPLTREFQRAVNLREPSPECQRERLYLTPSEAVRAAVRTTGGLYERPLWADNARSDRFPGKRQGPAARNGNRAPALGALRGASRGVRPPPHGDRPPLVRIPRALRSG